MDSQMFKQRSLLCLLFLFLLCGRAHAQEAYLEVNSFQENPNDREASMYPVKDSSGKACALIKVSTNLSNDEKKNLKFWSQGLEVQKVEYTQTGGIYVYVPEKSSSIHIGHIEYRDLDYTYPIQPIKSGTVYEMFLRGNKPSVITPVNSNKQFLTINFLPKDAKLLINGEEVETLGGNFSQSMTKGTYTFRLRADKYRTQEGELVLDDQPVVRSFSLTPLYTTLNLSTHPENGATILIDGKPIGQQTPLTDYLIESGTKGIRYDLRVMMKNYLPRDTTIEVTPGHEPFYIDLAMTSTALVRSTFILAEAALGSAQPSFGLMVGMTKRNGGYLHARTDFNNVSTSLECDDTGRLADGSGLPYYKEGATHKSRLSLTAGYMRRLVKPLYAYIGAGYGQRTLAWETLDGELVKNTDHSCSGVSAEVGAIGRFGSFAISLGYQTTMFKYHEASLGLGVFF